MVAKKNSFASVFYYYYYSYASLLSVFSSSSSFRLEDYIQRVIRRLFTFFSSRLCFERKSTRREKKTRSIVSRFVSSTSLAALHQHHDFACALCTEHTPKSRVFFECRRAFLVVDKETTTDYYITSDDDDDEMTMRFIPPAPSTSILIVPLGPRLVFMTSCKPFAALMFMNNAAALSMDSAFGFTERREDAIFFRLFCGEFLFEEDKEDV